MAAFDFHTLTLAIDSTLQDYLSAQRFNSAEYALGLNLVEISTGDRSQFLSFRHEHAHFSSFVASGLADLHGVIGDYLHALLYRVVQDQLAESPALVLPLGEGEPVVRAAWDQINRLRACLFGFGTRDSLAAVTDWGAQEAFWSRYPDERFLPIVGRYHELLARLADDGGRADESALPRVQVAGQERYVSARAVMEAYAVSVELMATHLRKIETVIQSEDGPLGTQYSRATTRRPGPLYTTALEYALCALTEPKNDLSSFLAGNSPTSSYYFIAVVTFTAMQVPVIQLWSGEVSLEGTLATLSVAHRFRSIIDGIRCGAIPPPPDGLRTADNRDELLVDWMTECHHFLRDAHSLDFSWAALAAYEENADLQAVTSQTQTLIELSWAARANFIAQPAEWVLDAGLWAERFPCQPRSLRTSDGKVVYLGDDNESFQARHMYEHTVPLFEAAIFRGQWDSAWSKLPEIPPEDRLDFLRGAIALSMVFFGDFDPELPPSFTLEAADDVERG